MAWRRRDQCTTIDATNSSMFLPLKSVMVASYCNSSNGSLWTQSRICSSQSRFEMESQSYSEYLVEWTYYQLWIQIRYSWCLFQNSLEYTHEETVRLIPRRTSTLIAYDDLYTDEEYYTFHKYMRPDRDLCLYMGSSIITGTLVPLCKYSYLFVLSQEGEKYIEFDVEIECSIESQEHS